MKREGTHSVFKGSSTYVASVRGPHSETVERNNDVMD